MANSLNIAIVEQLNVDGVLQTIKTESSVDNILFYDKRTVPIPYDNQIDLIKFDTLVGNGQFIRDNVRYLRVANLDAIYSLRLRIAVIGNDTFDVEVKPKEFFVISSTNMNTSDSQSAFTGFQNPDFVQAQALITSPLPGVTGINIEYLLVSV